MRFPEFTEEWGKKKLGNIVRYENGKAHERDISESGKYIVVNSKFISTEGKIVKYTNEKFCIADSNDILMVLSDVPNGKAIAKCFFVESDDMYTVNQRICKLKSSFVDSLLLFYILNRNPYFLTFDDGVNQTNLKKDDILTFSFFVPLKGTEQNKIASFLSLIDQRIETQKKIIEDLKLLKSAISQCLLLNKTWEEYRICDIATIGRGRVINATEIKKQNNPKYPVYSSQTSNNGVMGYLDSYDFEGEYVTWTTDGANAGTVFHRNGRFNCTNVCGTLKINDSHNPYFVSLCLDLVAKKHVFVNLANPKLMNNVMARIKVALPDLFTQNKIVELFKSVQAKTELEESSLRAYGDMKIYLLQNLFI